MKVAVLCCAGRSYYRYLDQVVCYGERENARTFPGGMPVVAHPPCRCWSKFLRSQARPADRAAEMALGLWCVRQVIENGGVLEHPAHSGLWSAADLPQPGDMADPFLYTFYVEQNWFGYPVRKRTWLLVAGVPRSSLPEVPFRFELCRGDWHDYKELRSRTVPAFAEWLLSIARSTWWTGHRKLNSPAAVSCL